MDNKKRILIVARWPVGGIRTYFRYIYSQKKFEEYNFTFVMPDDGKLREFLLEHCPKLKFDFVESSDKNLSLLKLLQQELKTRRYSLLHSHGYTAGAVSVVALMLSPKIKHLMTAHDVFLKNQFDGLKGKLKYLGMRFSFKSMDAIHAVSNDCKDNFLEFFPSVKPEKVTTILHGVDTEKFYSEPARDFRAELGFTDEFLLGFFGRFMAQKGFKYIVEAMSLLVEKKPEYRSKVRVLTFGWGGFVREEFDYIASKGLSDLFVQMPHTDNMPAAIKGVDTVLMPSLWEACGLLGMEALAAGVPIIGTNCIGLREVLEGSPATVVVPRDSEALLSAIIDHIEDARASSFIDYSLNAKQRFALDKPATELSQLYKKMI